MTLSRLAKSKGCLLVLRCLVWIETTSSRQLQIELAGQQVDDGLEVSG